MAILTAITLTVLPPAKVLADDSTMPSTQENTWRTWNYARQIESDLTLLLIFFQQWLMTPSMYTQDNSTAKLQSNFSNYTNNILKIADINNNLQNQLTYDFLGDKVTVESAPYVNDLTYQTLLGKPYINPDPRIATYMKSLNLAGLKNLDPARNYIKNIAGVNIRHVLPDDNWKGGDVDKQNYKNFYNTISSIQTFNFHILGEIYADYKNGGAASAQQAKLIQQASNSDWFSQVATEPVGLVLRQLLMYNSQLLVIANQLLQTQKEMLAAQAMSNTLIVLGNQFNETLLLNRATGMS